MSKTVTRNAVETVLRDALIRGNLSEADRAFLKEMLKDEYECAAHCTNVKNYGNPEQEIENAKTRLEIMRISKYFSPR